MQKRRLRSSRRAQRRKRARRVLHIAVAAVFLPLMLMMLWISLRRAPSGEAPGRPAAATQEHLPSLFDSMSIVAGLPPPDPSTPVPVNSVDRFTGMPIIESSPTVSYKGYVVAFCCPHSRGYTGDWARLSQAEKDTYIRSFLDGPP